MTKQEILEDLTTIINLLQGDSAAHGAGMAMLIGLRDELAEKIL